MTVYMIGYDKVGPNYDYKPLIDAIANLGDCRDALDSTWLVVSDKTAIQIRDQLQTLMHKDDRILVLEVVANSAWSLRPVHSGWLKQFV